MPAQNSCFVPGLRCGIKPTHGYQSNARLAMCRLRKIRGKVKETLLVGERFDRIVA